jgi:thiaminase/transcriptional activator TenA
VKFTDMLWQQIRPIYQAIVEHPFNQELAQGILPQNKFAFYMQQDALYLVDFGRALAIMGSRSATPERMLDFVKFSEGAVVVERALHESYFTLFDISQPTGEQSPACFIYTNFLIATTTHKSYEEGMAALLPCFWIYRDVGQHIYKTTAANNPYQQWIDTYAGDEFSRSVDKAIEITDELAEQTTEARRSSMTEAFIKSSRLEWMFWDSAYRLESWPPYS